MRTFYQENYRLNSNLKNLKEQWGMLQSPVQQSILDRNQQPKLKLQKIEKMIKTNEQFNLMKDQVNLYLSKSIEEKLNFYEFEIRDISSTIYAYDQICSQFKDRTKKAVDEVDQTYEKNTNKFQKNTIEKMINTLSIVQKKLDETQINSTQNLKSSFEEFVEGEQILKRNLKELKKSHQNKIEDLCENITEQVEVLDRKMKDLKQIQHKNSLKLGSMVEDLEFQLQELIEEEKRQGTITYDCLLNLLQDLCEKMHEIMIK